MDENNGGVFLFPDADEFLAFMQELQKQYNKGENDEENF